ncbi:hypothetical protein HK105_203797 [Polyrhizophydium stewartii]|uniref:Uncharacterized protein n=1 Tax=Polyrhizophydium stewartii TaxID=2732419 RepID=A0ABR4NAZ7_9FUNG|nr:hypothetical protein HK105_006377 [Polyrhizophydium stewartii]
MYFSANPHMGSIVEVTSDCSAAHFTFQDVPSSLESEYCEDCDADADSVHAPRSGRMSLSLSLPFTRSRSPTPLSASGSSASSTTSSGTGGRLSPGASADDSTVTSFESVASETRVAQRVARRPKWVGNLLGRHSD